MIARLDRYLLRRGLAALLVVLLLTTALVLGMHFVLNLKLLLRGTLPPGADRWPLIGSYYLYSLPTFISPVLPLALALAMIAATAPMLKRSEFTALGAGAIGPRRACRALLGLALAVGATDVVLSDQLAPRWESRRQAIEDVLGDQIRSGRVFRIEETGTVWYANTVTLRTDGPPRLDFVLVAPASAGLILARSLVETTDGWRLTGPILRWQEDAQGQDHLSQPDHIDCQGELAIPMDGDRLAQTLVARQALTGDELWHRGDHLHLALLAGRWSRFFVPLAVILIVLPLFVADRNRGRLLPAAIKAVLCGLAPMVVVAAGAYAADAAAMAPLLVVGLFTAAALAPGIWLTARWRL